MAQETCVKSLPEWLNQLETPFLLIDEARYQRNVDRLYRRVAQLGSVPNHVCATTGMHQHYQVWQADSDQPQVWSRIMGW